LAKIFGTQKFSDVTFLKRPKKGRPNFYYGNYSNRRNTISIRLTKPKKNRKPRQKYQLKKITKKKGRLIPKREPDGRSTKTGRTNRETRDKPQWIETQRSLSHVQRPDHN
jgi:hypothetical protein